MAHELAPTEPAGEKRCASGTRISADRAGRREAACRWHANERRSHLPIRSVLPVCHWQTAPEPAGETAGAAPPFVLRCARRSAKQKKAVPAKNSEAIFWRPRFTWPLRAGKRANANFACSEGFFLSGCRAIWRAGRSCAAGRCYAGFCARCPGVFSLLQLGRLCVRFAADRPAFCIFVPGSRAVSRFCVWPALSPVAFVFVLRR